jgi:hypothetical protein
MLFGYTVPLAGIVVDRLKIRHEAVVKFLGAVVASRFIVNHRMMRGYVACSGYKMSAFFRPELSRAGIYNDSALATARRILVPAILR